MARKRTTSKRIGTSNFSGIGPMVTAIILVLLVPVVVVVLLNELAPIFFGNLSDLVTTLAGVDTGSPLGNVILALFATIIFPIIAVVFFVGIASDSLGRRGGSV